MWAHRPPRNGFSKWHYQQANQLAHDVFPNLYDPCFEWKRPSFGGFKLQNRGQTGSKMVPSIPWVVSISTKILSTRSTSPKLQSCHPWKHGTCAWQMDGTCLLFHAADEFPTGTGDVSLLYTKYRKSGNCKARCTCSPCWNPIIQSRERLLGRHGRHFSNWKFPEKTRCACFVNFRFLIGIPFQVTWLDSKVHPFASKACQNFRWNSVAVLT